jgi:predicted membrane chloride channel (bestrophin family)
VVTLAVYFYFGVSLIGKQWLLGDEVDIYYPIFMTIKFLFLFGWLSVSETLYNPFGEDDEDFELNELLNRHF